MRFLVGLIGLSVCVGLTGCVGQEPIAISLCIENRTAIGECVESVAFPQTDTELFFGWIGPNGGGRENHSVAVPLPHDQVVIRLQSDKGDRREFSLDIREMGRINSIDRIEYRFVITDQGLSAVPPAEWDSSRSETDQLLSCDVNALLPKVVPVVDVSPEVDRVLKDTKRDDEIPKVVEEKSVQ